MAQLARDYHKKLQSETNLPTLNEEEYIARVRTQLNEIPREQKLHRSHRETQKWSIYKTQVKKALKLAKNGSATGMDGCPYELWKLLDERYENAKKLEKEAFNIVEVLTILFRDIQKHGV
ncbi:hypothetical protein EDB83DRAFT_2171515, partial [Lactarius deliciosus]